MKNRPLYWVIIITLVLFVGLMWISPGHKETDPSHLPWNATYNQQGQLNALGLTLNQSTLKEVTELYGRDIEIKLFDMPDGERSAEAYLGSTYIGSIHTAMVIKLDIPKNELDAFYERGARTTVSQQGAREVQLNNEDTLAMFEYPIKEVSIVPRRNLTPEAIDKRFGEPTRVQTDENGVERWFFNDKGLELILIDGDKDILRYRKQ